MTRFFLTLLQLSIGTANGSDKEHEALLPLSMEQWKKIMLLAERQGVIAIAFDGVQRLFDDYKKKIRAASVSSTEWMQWVFECTSMVTQYEQSNRRQKKLSVRLLTPLTMRASR